MQHLQKNDFTDYEDLKELKHSRSKTQKQKTAIIKMKLLDRNPPNRRIHNGQTSTNNRCNQNTIAQARGDYREMVRNVYSKRSLELINNRQGTNTD